MDPADIIYIIISGKAILTFCLSWFKTVCLYMDGGRSWKAEQLFVGFTCRNSFGPCGTQIEKT